MVPNAADMTSKFASNVAIISTNGPIGNNVMTCAWINRVSFNPNLISIAIGKDRASLKNIKKTKEFGVSLCSDEENVLASVAGSCSGREVDKIQVLKELGFKFYKASKIDCLMIENSSLNLECKMIKEVEAGDHILIIGEVIEGKTTSKQPLLYNSGKYWKIGTQVQKPNADILEKINRLVEKNTK